MRLSSDPMTISVLFCPVDAPPEVREIESGLTPMRELLNDGWLEAIVTGEDFVAYADEEGQLKGLPVNHPATLLLQASGWSGPAIVGPVVFAGLHYAGEDGYVEISAPERFLSAGER